MESTSTILPQLAAAFDGFWPIGLPVFLALSIVVLVVSIIRGAN